MVKLFPPKATKFFGPLISTTGRLRRGSLEYPPPIPPSPPSMEPWCTAKQKKIFRSDQSFDFFSTLELDIRRWVCNIPSSLFHYRKQLCGNIIIINVVSQAAPPASDWITITDQKEVRRVISFNGKEEKREQAAVVVVSFEHHHRHQAFNSVPHSGTTTPTVCSVSFL